MNINIIFSTEKIIQKYTNDEIFASLYGKINTNKALEFIQKLRRENPTIRDTLMNKQIDIEFDDIQGRNWNDYYSTSTISPTGKIFSMVNTAIDRINDITNGLFNRIASLFDSKTMVLSGGSLIRSILQKDIAGHFDFDIFGTSLGLLELIEALRDIYSSIILCHEYNCVFNIMIPGQKIILQYIVTDRPIEWIIGTKARHGFDLEHLKNVVIYNEETSKLELICSYNSFYALKRWETNQSTDVKGVLQPHRFMKATNTIPIKKTPIFAEYSAQLFGKSATKKDFKYIHIPAEYDERNYNFILRKIFNIQEDYGIYFIGQRVSRVYSYINIWPMTQKDFMDELLSVVSTDKKPNMETTNINTLSAKKTEEIKEEKRNVEYNDFMSIPHTPLYNIYSGLIPPVRIIKPLGKQLFLAKPYCSGPIMEKLLKTQEYVVLKFEKKEKNDVFPDNVLYCDIENTFSKKTHEVRLDNVDDDTVPLIQCRVLNVIKYFRYADLE